MLEDKNYFLVLASKLRERAEEALTIADDFRDPETRRMMLKIAERYKILAEGIEKETDSEASDSSVQLATLSLLLRR
jgi:hypothetical protein